MDILTSNDAFSRLVEASRRLEASGNLLAASGACLDLAVEGKLQETVSLE